MFKPSSNVEPIEVLTQPKQRRRHSVDEKLAIVRETFEPGASVSGAARRDSIDPHQALGDPLRLGLTATNSLVLRIPTHRADSHPAR